MGEHLMKHGDGARDVAFQVEDCDFLIKVFIFNTLFIYNTVCRAGFQKCVIIHTNSIYNIARLIQCPVHVKINVIHSQTIQIQHLFSVTHTGITLSIYNISNNSSDSLVYSTY